MSLLCRLKNLVHKGILKEKDLERIVIIPKGQEPCDCISRAELLKAIDTWDKFGVDDTNSLFRLDNLSLPHYVPYIHYDDVVKAIKGMPSIQPKTEWIPVSERVPEKGKQVLCCNKSGSVFTSAITYINSNGMVSFGQHYEVIAWMPLPEPYKTEKE